MLLHETLSVLQLNQIYHIISGDPSRGTIALESDAAPVVGTTVQVLSHQSAFLSTAFTPFKQAVSPSLVRIDFKFGEVFAASAKQKNRSFRRFILGLPRNGRR